MNTRLSTKSWDHEPHARYRHPVDKECGCGREAKYYVYENKQPHCDYCFNQAINCSEMVPVQTI